MAQLSEFDQTMQAAFDTGLADMKVFVPLFCRPTVAELQADVLAFEKAISGGHSRQVVSVD